MPARLLELLVTGTDTVKTISPFGVEKSLPVRNGKVLLPVSELPSYVEFSGSLEVSRVDWGQNLARQAGVSAAASGSTVHPIDPSINNAIGKVFNGQLDSWYWTQARDARIWESNNATYPAWFELRLPSAQQIDRVVIYAGIPWQWDGSILDYELQVEQGARYCRHLVRKSSARFATSCIASNHSCFKAGDFSRAYNAFTDTYCCNSA